jgi:hypothetical protein
LKPAQANSSVRPYLKKAYHKKSADGVAQGIGPEFKHQYCKKKNFKSHFQIILELEKTLDLNFKTIEINNKGHTIS